VINSTISFGVAILLAVLLKLLNVNLWIGSLAGLVAGAAAFWFIAKNVQDRLETIFKQASEQLKPKQHEPAIKAMQKGYALAPWQFGVKSAVNAQIGMLYYVLSKPAEAEPLLKASGMNHYAKAMLAILQWKRGATKLAKDTFASAIGWTGRKESIIYALYAYVLNEMRDRNAAIEVLNRGLKYCKDDERLLTNRTLLQNKKPMKMTVYGNLWYQFMLERPVVRQELPPFIRMPRRQ
jgi:predicted Zn-dependent protease